MAWEQHSGNDAGAMNGDGSRKLLLHTTEGSTIEGAIGAYRINNSWPHLTVDCRKRRAVQHLPLDVAARSLRNAAGGQDTNRDGKVLVQIEIVGFAGTPSSIGSKADLEWFGREVVAPIARRTGIPLTTSVRWAAYPGSYGKNAAQRLHGAAWDAYSGVLGHQHADENDHGDPGAIDIDTILDAARGDEDDMTMTAAERKDLIADIAAASGQKCHEEINEGFETRGSVIRKKTVELVAQGIDVALDVDGELGQRLAKIEAKLDALSAAHVAPEVPDASPTP